MGCYCLVHLQKKNFESLLIMEPKEKKEAETSPVDVSLVGEDKDEAEPRPVEASTKQRDENEDSSTPFNATGESVSTAQEDQGSPEVPSLAVELESKGEDDAPAGRDIKSLSAGTEENTETMVKPSTLSHSVEKENMPTAKYKTAGSLRARALITKKFPVANSIKKKVRPGDSKPPRSKGMKKKGLLSTNDGVSKDEPAIKESTSDDKNLPGSSSKVKAIKEKETLAQEKGGESRPNRNGEQATEKTTTGDTANQRNNVVKEFCKGIKSKNKQKFGAASEKKKRKLDDREELQSRERAENSRKKGEVNDTRENRKENGNKKEKLGGLIFMCNSKTKPDCIKYRVMGVSVGKKDLVMAIRPGLKLFLYDYDLKLMYGIFKASSAGGIKLEPRAFNGAFPVQVRFNIQVECHPLPEAVFKKAMLESFTSKHKFRTELSHKQVRKLSKLFEPVALGVDPPPRAEKVPDRPPKRKRTREENSRARERSPRHRPRSKRSGRDSHNDREARRHKVRVYERGQRDLSPLQRVEAPRELFLTEREYRAYGLQGERRNLTIPGNIDPGLPSREAYYEGDLLARRADEVRRDAIPGQRDYVLASRRYMDGIDYQNYSRDTRPELSPATAGRSTSSAAHHFYPEDQYITYRYAPASLVPYAEHLRREDIPAGSLRGYDRAQAYGYEAARVRRMEDVPTGSGSVIYTTDALAEYDRAIRYRIPPADASYMPVSSRYSFAGPRI